MEKKKGFFEGSFGKFVLPGIILQSVMIGGGYATGREIVEYGAKYGALGWLSGLGTFLGFAVIAALTYELIRLTKAYDFKTFMKTIGGPLWIVFDIFYLLFMVVIIAVMASATGNIVEQTLGLNYWVGVVAITVVVAILNFYGSRLIERFETLGTVALYAGYIIFAVLVIGTFGKNISTVFANHDTSFIGGLFCNETGEGRFCFRQCDCGFEGGLSSCHCGNRKSGFPFLHAVSLAHQRNHEKGYHEYADFHSGAEGRH